MSDDESAPVVRRPAPKKVVAAASDSDSDDGPVVKRPAPKAVARAPAAAAGSDDDEDDTPVVRRPAAKVSRAARDSDSDDDDGPVVVRPGHTDPTAGVDTDSDADGDDEGMLDVSKMVDQPDYDEMTEEAFLAHLKGTSKARRLDEKRLLQEHHRQQQEASSSNDARHFDGSPAHSYAAMLERIIATCRQNNPELATTERIRLPMPRIEKSGSKKTALTNFREVCTALNRTQEEVKDYFEKALTVQSAIDGNNCLILKYQNAKVGQFEKLIAKYMEEYVQCKACGRINTTLTKEQSSRLHLMNCKDCGASRYIQAAGGATFTAQVGKRSRQRNNAMT